MRQIGRGLQYTVYDLYNGRVHKAPNGLFTRLKILASWGEEWNLPRHPINALRTAMIAAQTTRRSIQELREHLSAIDPTLLANPSILKGVHYEQDKVPVIGELRKYTEEKAKGLIYQYVSSVEERWRWGLGETVFNFTINCGIDRIGQIVLLDLGEITFSLEEMTRLVHERVWEKAWSIVTLPVPLREVALSAMKVHFTEMRLREIWRKKRTAV